MTSLPKITIGIDAATRAKLKNNLVAQLSFFSITQTDDPIPRTNFTFSVYYVLGALAALLYALLDTTCTEITTYLVNAPHSRCTEMLAAFTCQTADYDSVAGTGFAETFNSRTCQASAGAQSVGIKTDYPVARCEEISEASFSCKTADYDEALGTGHRQFFRAENCPKDGQGTGAEFGAYPPSTCQTFSESSFTCETDDFNAATSTGTRNTYTTSDCPTDGAGSIATPGTHDASFCREFVEGDFTCSDNGGANSRTFYRIQAAGNERETASACPGAIAGFKEEIAGWIADDADVLSRKYQGDVRITSSAMSGTIELTESERAAIVGDSNDMWAYWRFIVDDDVDLEHVAINLLPSVFPLLNGGEELRVHAPGYIFTNNGATSGTYYLEVDDVAADGDPPQVKFFDYKVSTFFPEVLPQVGVTSGVGSLYLRARVFTVWYLIKKSSGSLPSGSFELHFDATSGVSIFGGNALPKDGEYVDGRCVATRNVPFTYATCSGTRDVPVVFDTCLGTIDQTLDFAFCDGFVNVCPETPTSVRFSQAMAYAATWMSALAFVYNFLGQRELERRMDRVVENNDLVDADEGEDDAPAAKPGGGAKEDGVTATVTLEKKASDAV